MIDKEKTIKKAIMKYHTLLPVRGKHSVEECFFCMRGENFFIFRTKDKKIHTMRAEEHRPAAAPALNKHEALDSIIKILNKPIIVRSLIVKKPVTTCLINLFPVPGISWSSNKSSLSRPAPAIPENHHAEAPERFNPDLLPIAGRSAEYAYAQPQPVQDAHLQQPAGYYNQQYNPQCDTGTYQYDILATGQLPISIPAEWIPAVNATSAYTYPQPYPVSQVPVREPDRIFSRQYNPQGDMSTRQYYILATGKLPVNVPNDL